MLPGNEVTAAALSWFLEKVANPFLSRLKLIISRHRRNLDWQEAEKTYRQRLVSQYSNFRMLGKSTPTHLKDIFTDVNLFENPIRRQAYDINALANESPKRFHHVSSRQQRVPALSLIKNGENLFILGKPGAGKTTLLRYVTIQIATHNILNRVPIFISLHEWSRSKHKELFPFIVDQFAECQFKDPSVYIDHILFQGEAIILFDGLDEVRKEYESRSYAAHLIQAFAKKYPTCQYLITCRIAASEYTFQGFHDVEVADFNDHQIQTYASKWFTTHSEKATEFLEELEKPSHSRLKELCQSPLLLSLVCLAYDENGSSFPERRASIYKEGIDALIRRWDSVRNILRDTIYPGFTIDHRINLFADLAARSFESDMYYFTKEWLIRHIKQYLSQLPGIPSSMEIDVEEILTEIESQHGIFIERANSIYSFAHLSIQEYFTALYAINDSTGRARQKLIEKHLFDDRWHEVFLLYSSLLSQADDFLQMFRAALDSWISTDSLLTTALTRANQTIRNASSISGWRPIAVRLFYLLRDFEHAFAISQAIHLSISLVQASEIERETVIAQVPSRNVAFALITALRLDENLKPTLDKALSLALALDFTITLLKYPKKQFSTLKILDFSRSFAFQSTPEFSVSRTLALPQALQLSTDIAKLLTVDAGIDLSLFYCWAYAVLFSTSDWLRDDPSIQKEMKHYSDLSNGVLNLSNQLENPDLATRLQKLQCPDVSASAIAWQRYSEKVLKILRWRHAVHEWDIQNVQITRLNQYLVANELFVQCLNISVVSVSDRQNLLESLLAPPMDKI